MKIGINLVNLHPGKIGGMEQYIRNLLWFLSKHHPEIKLFVFLGTHNLNRFNEFANNIKRIAIDQHKDRNSEFNYWIHVLDLDLWFCPLVMLEPINLNIPTVVTIPDIQHEYYPQFFNADQLKWRNENIKFSAINASAILTLSNYSKQTMIEKYQVPKDKIYSIHLDATKEFYLENNEEINKRVLSKYQLFEKYGFYPANTWPHKNHMNLLKAVVLLRDKFNTKINLVFTGSESLSAEASQTYELIKSYIDQHKLKDQIKFLGYIDQEEIPYLYRNSRFLIFPSYFEGFGLPLVEAMRTRTPIVSSNTGSIPEVVEDCALLFDPQNPEEIAAKILEIHKEDIRRDLIEKGLRQVNKFSWENSAYETLRVFKSLYSNRVTPRRKEGSELYIFDVLQSIFEKEDDEFVAELYRHILNREPDPEGYQYHLNCLFLGVSRISILTGFLQSQEAAGLYQDNKMSRA